MIEILSKGYDIFFNLFILLGLFGVMTLSLNLVGLIEKYIEMKRESNRVSTEELEKINTMFSTIIEESFNEYLYLNGFKFKKEKEYITEELEKEMCMNISKEVVSRISTDMYNKLKLIYNENNIEDIMAQKIYIFVSVFVSNNNSVQ